MNDSMLSSDNIHINNQDEAIHFLETALKPHLQTYYDNVLLGEVSIREEAEAQGHTFWQFHIDGMLFSRDGRKFWLVDDGSRLDTTMAEDKNTIEKAFIKSKSK